jgi:hypothetical protein
MSPYRTSNEAAQFASARRGVDDAAAKETPMKRIFTLFMILGLAAPLAHAQDDDPGLLEGDLLEQKKPAEKPVLDDPDLKLDKEVTQARDALEKRLNPLQEKVVEFPKIDAKLQKIMGKWLQVSDTFIEEQAGALDAYRAAIKESRNDEKTKQGKAIVKARKALLKKISNINKNLDKLDKKLAKAIKKAEAE